jgi:HSP20 family protein
MSTLLHRQPSSLIDELMAWMGTVSGEPEIRIEEYVDGDQHVIKADLPGVDPDKDIDVSIEAGLLRLHVQRREEQHEKTRTEIRYGSFDRAVVLPIGTTAEQVAADYKDGVLTVTFPASGREVSQRVQIKRAELPAE